MKKLLMLVALSLSFQVNANALEWVEANFRPALPGVDVVNIDYTRLPDTPDDPIWDYYSYLRGHPYHSHFNSYRDAAEISYSVAIDERYKPLIFHNPIITWDRPVRILSFDYVTSYFPWGPAWGPYGSYAYDDTVLSLELDLAPNAPSLIFIDNLKYQVVPGYLAPVPEPSTYLLFGAGLLIMFLNSFFIRRKLT